MRWYGLRLMSDRAAVHGRIWKLLWEASVAGEQADEGNAIFLAHDGPGWVTLYFSPSAGMLATAMGASRCGKPDAGGLTLLAGAPLAWRVHFHHDGRQPMTLRARAAA